MKHTHESMPAKTTMALLLATAMLLGSGVILAGPGRPDSGGQSVVTADEICTALPTVGLSAAQVCQALICELRTDLDTVTFLSRQGDRDKATLLSKLSDGVVKIEEDKALPDTYTKLSLFEAKVEAMRDATKAKFSEDDADFLLYGLDLTMDGTLGDGGVDTALACVSNL